MPLYTIKNNETGEVKEELMSITDMSSLVAGGEWTLIPSTPMIISQHGTLTGKTSDGFNDLLKTIKKHSGAGNTIKTK